MESKGTTCMGERERRKEMVIREITSVSEGLRVNVEMMVII